MSIYTKTGDRGETGLVSSDPNNPIRISKSSAKIEAIGTIDELNSFLGIVKTSLKEEKTKKLVAQIQSDLFTIGSILANAKLKFSESKTKVLEKQIDMWEEQLPVLKNFILPGGTYEASLLFYARTLARRAERRLVALQEIEEIKPKIIRYLNRLSDLLFTFGRILNSSEGVSEDLWIPLKPSKK